MCAAGHESRFYFCIAGGFWSHAGKCVFYSFAFLELLHWSGSENFPLFDCHVCVLFMIPRALGALLFEGFSPRRRMSTVNE